ncbi:MAG: Cna B-type domain-containing protein [Varibaculum cambriense]|nr:Cna B-type domain-containing protein [Varibaculum cambriense]
MRNHSITGRVIAEVAAVILTAALAITWMVTTDAKLNQVSAQASGRTVVECGTDCEEATLRQLIKDAGTTPTRIVVSGWANTLITSTVVIPAGADIELVNGLTNSPSFPAEGGLVRENGFTGVMVKVEKGASLTMGNNEKGGKFYLRSRGQWVPGGGELIYNEGSLTINGGTYEGVRNGTGQRYGAITVRGKDAKFVLNDGKVTDNKRTIGSATTTQSGAANISVSEGAQFVMNGGEVSYGETSYEHGAYGEVGGIGVYQGGSVTINGGEISHNKGWAGGLEGYDLYVDAASMSDLPKALETRNYITINGGKIHNNDAYFSGGGALALGNAVITMNGGLIDSNYTTGNGGGIGTLDLYAWGADETYKEIPGTGKRSGLSKEEWGKLSPGAFIFNGGTISNNEAVRTGGGINVVSNQVEINKGQILNNTAHDQGGGIYVASVSFSLHLHDVVVTKNKATSQNGIESMGGGLWSCPTGSVELRIHNGGALFDNTADSFGNDLAHTNLGSTGAAPIWVSDYMLGGGRINYYFDNRDHRFDPASLNKPEKERPKPMPLKYMSINDQGFQAVTSDEAKGNALAAAKLLVQGNAAPRGGGIGTNGGVVFGDWGYAQATVEKAWLYHQEKDPAGDDPSAGDTGKETKEAPELPARASDIPVKELKMRFIRSTDKDFTQADKIGQAEKVADFKLTPSNNPEENWRKTFNDLPIKDESGNFYYYGVQELNAKGKVIKTLQLKPWQVVEQEDGKVPQRPALDRSKQLPETWLVATVVNPVPNPVDITVNKHWLWQDFGKPVPDAKTPDKVSFELLQATDAKFSDAKKVKEFDVTKSEGWTKTLQGLPFSNQAKQRYYYGVREIGGDGTIKAVPLAKYESETGKIKTDKDGVIRREVTVVNTVPVNPPPTPPEEITKTGTPVAWLALLATVLIGSGLLIKRRQQE